jgi:phenolic acid decarboxylase
MIMHTISIPAARPFVGHTFRIQYGLAMTVLNIYADDGITMRYEVTEGEFAGATAEVRYTAVELAPGLYALSWQEADKGTVVHIDDFSDGSSRSFYTTAGLDFMQMEGSLAQLR